MIDNGFFIKKLCVFGDEVKNANIEFEKGANIITGPSDTGKSYIYDCINYMLGSSRKPKEINEAKGYTTILMEIKMYSGKTHTIVRKIGENKVKVYDAESHLIENITEPKILKVKHDKEKQNNLSVFYLSKSGFTHPTRIRKNKKGDVRTLSFRDLPIYVAISEEKIIKESSPIHSGQHMNSTVEKEIFDLIVYGEKKFIVRFMREIKVSRQKQFWKDK